MDDIRNKIICGNSLEVISTWPAAVVDCCVTSPPYWGLRDYGLAPTKWPDGSVCCYGLEPTPELYVEHTVLIFREVWRALKPEGTLWLNLGDSYCSGTKGRTKAQVARNTTLRGGERTQCQSLKQISKMSKGLKVKDLCFIPHRVAMALQADGWYARQDIVWHKPNPAPESVRDRCTRAHEYIFLLTKQPNYYCDMDAIKEPMAESSEVRLSQPNLANQKGSDRVPGKTNGPMKAVGRGGKNAFRGQGHFRDGNGPANRDGRDMKNIGTSGLRNKRSVWTVTPKPYSEAHFATFPPDLIEPCILAGCPEQVCKKCGKARTRITESEQIKRRRKTPPTKPCDDRSQSPNAVAGVETKTTGWSDCGCGAGFQPGIVLDPFMGSGTTAMVAYENRRDYAGCELNPDYIKLNRADKAKAKYGLFESES